MAKPPKKDDAPPPQISDEDPLGINQQPASEADTGKPADPPEPVENAAETDLAEPVAEPVAEGEAAVVPAVPAAPGDDPASVFERRMARLVQIVEDAEFESGTALGDIVDVIVELYKARPTAWNAMDSNAQRDTIRHIEIIAKKILGKVVLVVAQEDSNTIEGTLLPGFTVKGDAVEGKVKVEHVDGDSLLDIYRLAGHKVVIISADDKRFSSRRRDIDTPGNQSALPFADPAPKAITSDPPAHPENDSDLADDEEEAEEEEAQEPDPNGVFGVFDEGIGEWLIDENGGDDGWTANVDDAGRWPHEKATELSKAFGDDVALAVRLLDPKPEAEG